MSKNKMRKAVITLFLFASVELFAEEMHLPDGSAYTGGLKDGLFDGEGKLVYFDGSTYEGGFEAGLFAGKGTLTNDYYSYDGDFADGKMNGKGKMEYPDGSFYEGSFVNGLFEGRKKNGLRLCKFLERRFLYRKF